MQGSYSTTPIPEPTIYMNTLSTINDYPSLIKFYDLMFGTHPFVFMTMVFIGLYTGCLLYEKYNKDVIKNDCNKN